MEATITHKASRSRRPVSGCPVRRKCASDMLASRWPVEEVSLPAGALQAWRRQRRSLTSCICKTLPHNHLTAIDCVAARAAHVGFYQQSDRQFVAEKHHEAIFQHNRRSTAWRAIEFFAGIGGFACAWPEVDIATAIDIDTTARDVYQQNWPHPYLISEITSLTAAALQRLDANLWWLSPPCQPYSRRGRQRDVDDPRSAALLHLIWLLPDLRPRGFVLENVIGFSNSRARSLLEETLHRCGYNVISRELCPTELGWPNRRPRFYLIACQESLADWRPLPQYALTLDNLLRETAGDQALEQAVDEDACRISAEHQALYGNALDRVERTDRDAVTACFGSSYGKSLLHAGSYLIAQDRWRRFAPREVASLLGYPATFAIAGELSYRRAWKLLGNSLSIPAVRYILSHLPDFTPRR